jgi:hypothetical protein
MNEYLLSYGVLGDFGRFCPVKPLNCVRGERAVVHSPRGLELATVLADARPGHAHFLPNTTVGQLLRHATPADLAVERQRRDEARRFCDDAATLAASLNLPIAVIDAEVLLDGEHAVLHHVAWAEFDARPWVSALSKSHNVHISLFDLTRPAAAEGCGRPDCGQGSGGCGSDGGCSTCGLKNIPDLKKYFAGLREQMTQAGRVAH